jgi:hypothetical protein
MAVPPPSVIALAARSAAPPSRSSTAMAMPSAASRSLMARPMPEPPPVTTATFVVGGCASLTGWARRP